MWFVLFVLCLSVWSSVVFLCVFYTWLNNVVCRWFVPPRPVSCFVLVLLSLCVLGQMSCFALCLGLCSVLCDSVFVLCVLVLFCIAYVCCVCICVVCCVVAVFVLYLCMRDVVCV